MYNIGIIGTASIALNRFLPSLEKSKNFKFYGVASRSKEKAEKFTEKYNGKAYGSYSELINDENVDILYIPLPPSLHFKYAKEGILNKKHVILEKPFTLNLKETKELIELAKEKNVALMENYMFTEHKQLKKIKEIVKSNNLGPIRLIRAMFTFPKRSEDDFRYNKDLGGGALLDCGGYTLKFASEFILNPRVVYSKLYYDENTKVDFYGNAVIYGNGINGQVSFGMDNSYKCECEILCQKGYVKSSRIFTAGMDFNVVLEIEENGKVQYFTVGKDDHFLNSIEKFKKLIEKKDLRNMEFSKILNQSKLVESVRGENWK